VLDLQDISNIHEIGRVEEILPYVLPPVDNDYPTAAIDQEQGVVTGWEVRQIKERHYGHDDYYPMPIYYKDGSFLAETNAGGASSGMSGSGIGAGGSMARFAISGNVLYIMSEYEIKALDITNKANPVVHGYTYSTWNAETLFLSGKYMFIGTSNGMLVYDISNPLVPQQISAFSHATGCDPVIVDDTLAYITIRTGTTCNGASNVLSVVDIKVINQPKPVMTYPLTNPNGLGKDGDLLFICDGSAGLKIFDASDPKTITSRLIKNYTGIHAFDVIPVGGILMLIGDDGLYQYDYSDIQNISLLSSIVAE
jgi:hypothetical protein